MEVGAGWDCADSVLAWEKPRQCMVTAIDVQVPKAFRSDGNFILAHLPSSSRELRLTFPEPAYAEATARRGSCALLPSSLWKSCSLRLPFGRPPVGFGVVRSGDGDLGPELVSSYRPGEEFCQGRGRRSGSGA